MPFSNDAMTLLLARRSELYRRLGRMDESVAAAQKSPFFGTRSANSVTMRVPIEEAEAQIADIDGQISRIRGGMTEASPVTPPASPGARVSRSSR